MINSNHSLNKEQEFLLFILRQYFHKTDAKIKYDIPSEIDWFLFHSLIEKHGILPFIYTNLRKVNSNRIPSSALESMKTDYEIYTKRNLLLQAEMLKLTRIIQDQNITFIPYKGPVLAHQLYHSVALRQFDDLDALVYKKDFGQIKQILLDAGYNNIPGNIWDTQFLLRQHKYVNNEKLIALEIQTIYRPPGKILPFKMDYLIENLTDIDFNGCKIKTFNISDLLIILVIHGTKHRWEQLKWVLDVGMILKHNPDLEWEKILRNTENFGFERPFLASLNFIHHLFQVDLPLVISRKIKKMPLIRELTNKFLHDFISPGGKPEVIFSMKMRSKCCSKLLFGLYYLLSPNQKDRQVIKLPDKYYFFYFFIRPIRLLLSPLLILPTKLFKPNRNK